MPVAKKDPFSYFREIPLTSEDYKIAESNGISRDTAYARYYTYFWTKEETITRPVNRRTGDFTKYRKIALANGITPHVFQRAVKEGMTPEEASTKAVKRSTGRKGRFTDKQLETMKKNGIKRATANQRVCNYGWDPERAVTELTHVEFVSPKFL